MSFVVVDRAMASRLPSRDQAKSSIVRLSGKITLRLHHYVEMQDGRRDSQAAIEFGLAIESTTANRFEHERR